MASAGVPGDIRGGDASRAPFPVTVCVGFWTQGCAALTLGLYLRGFFRIRCVRSTIEGGTTNPWWRELQDVAGGRQFPTVADRRDILSRALGSGS